VDGQHALATYSAIKQSRTLHVSPTRSQPTVGVVRMLCWRWSWSRVLPTRSWSSRCSRSPPSATIARRSSATIEPCHRCRSSCL